MRPAPAESRAQDGAGLMGCLTRIAAHRASGNANCGRCAGSCVSVSSAAVVIEPFPLNQTLPTGCTDGNAPQLGVQGVGV
jgi:hypothetical protein